MSEPDEETAVYWWSEHDAWYQREHGEFGPTPGQTTPEIADEYIHHLFEENARLHAKKGDDLKPDPDDTQAPHYYIANRKYEPRLVIEDWRLNFNAGNVVKYMARYERKGGALGDLRKAREYLEFEIERLEKEE